MVRSAIAGVAEPVLVLIDCNSRGITFQITVEFVPIVPVFLTTQRALPDYLKISGSGAASAVVLVAASKI
jgi:hypothetical protein